MKKAMIDYMKKEKNDELYTPEYAIFPLLKYLPKNIKIWECTDYGESNITKVLKENAEHNDKVVDKVNWENQLLKKENKQLKQQLLIAQTNEETFRLEMEDITKTLGLDENTLFDDVKVCVKNLKDNWIKLKEWASNFYNSEEVGWAGCGIRYTLEKMQELEGSDSNEI